MAYVILRDKIGNDTAKTLPITITELMPPGLKGLMAAALMAALMSTIAAALNSVGTLVAVDIVGYFRPQASDAAQVRVGQISAVVLMLLAMAWSTQGGKFGTIFEIINKIPALFLSYYGSIFVPRNIKEAAALSNNIACEHLEIMTRSPLDTMSLIENAGAVFLGPWSPEALGDYSAGTEPFASHRWHRALFVSARSV